MSLEDKIKTDLREALKAKDEVKVSTLRFLVAEIKNVQLEKKAELNDEEIISLLKKQQKQRTEASSLYKKGGRQDLVQKEEAEKKIIESYLPAQLSTDSIKEIIEKVVRTSETQEFGQIMSQVMKQVAGKADGKIVAGLVKEKLSG